MEAYAIAKDIGISSQNVRLIIEGVRGKKVEKALAILRFTPSPAARAVAKVIKSAAANAENNFKMNPVKLKIVEASANEGHRLKRVRAQARGRSAPITRSSCHIKVIVGEEG